MSNNCGFHDDHPVTSAVRKHQLAVYKPNQNNSLNHISYHHFITFLKTIFNLKQSHLQKKNPCLFKFLLLNTEGLYPAVKPMFALVNRAAFAWCSIVRILALTIGWPFLWKLYKSRFYNCTIIRFYVSFYYFQYFHLKAIRLLFFSLQ